MRNHFNSSQTNGNCPNLQRLFFRFDNCQWMEGTEALPRTEHCLKRRLYGKREKGERKERLIVLHLFLFAAKCRIISSDTTIFHDPQKKKDTTIFQLLFSY